MVGDNETRPSVFHPLAQPPLGGLTASQALRYNTGKFLMSLVPTSLNRYVAAVLTYGAKKYDKHNWRKGFPWTSVLDSLQRHVDAFKAGEDFDAESGLPHVAHIACNAAFLVEHFDQMLGMDDRYKEKPGRELKFNEPPKV